MDGLDKICGIKLTNFANESILLITITNLNVGEGERRALSDVVDMVDPHPVSVLEPLVLTLDEFV